MVAESELRTNSADLLHRILVDLLQAGAVAGWPGADGLAVDDIINCYPQAIAAGEVPGWHDLQHRFPELADELQMLRTTKGWNANLSSVVRSQGAQTMQANVNQHAQAIASSDSCRLSRWLVSFGTGSSWYPVGEFVALDALAAIERAVEIFGPGAAHQAEEIPWDAAPLSKTRV